MNLLQNIIEKIKEFVNNYILAKIKKLNSYYSEQKNRNEKVLIF